jgi:uncharacterized membrane protein YfcA
MGMTVAGLDVAELVELGLLLIATGALSGFLAGLFGIGGGAVLVPVFYECFRLAVPSSYRHRSGRFARITSEARSTWTFSDPGGSPS